MVSVYAQGAVRFASLPPVSGQFPPDRRREAFPRYDRDEHLFAFARALRISTACAEHLVIGMRRHDQSAPTRYLPAPIKPPDQKYCRLRVLIHRITPSASPRQDGAKKLPGLLQMPCMNPLAGDQRLHGQQRIRASSQRPACATYQRSRAIFSSSESRVLPFTCASRSCPGDAAAHAAEFAEASDGRQGRGGGPTIDMSPESTAMSAAAHETQPPQQRVAAVCRSHPAKSVPSGARASVIVRIWQR